MASVFARAVSSDPADGCVHCDKDHVYGDPSVDAQLASLDKMAELAGAGNEVPDEYSDLGMNLCGSYNVDGDIMKQMKATIVSTMGRVEGNKNPSKREIVEFLNKHKNKLTCWGRHYLMKAFDERVFMTVYKKLFKEDLYSKDEFKIDYNAVMKIYNPETKQMEPMTVLDYIEKVALKLDHIVVSPDSVRNVAEIRRLIIRKFGAKHFSELTLAEKKDFEQLSAQR